MKKDGEEGEVNETGVERGRRRGMAKEVKESKIKKKEKKTI